MLGCEVGTNIKGKSLTFELSTLYTSTIPHSLTFELSTLYTRTTLHSLTFELSSLYTSTIPHSLTFELITKMLSCGGWYENKG
jgi:hypothetical protein